ncbi:DNA-directed RNA polymerase I subunit Rpa34p [Trichomonascus vanleenenianus]|uniref:DNA-directed RNA polymerase I subunit RPA34 n=1 Tax=Trichomonascus vanleenenianus TaxID=2268995 RepID=UPI003ECAC8F5
MTESSSWSRPSGYSLQPQKTKLKGKEVWLIQVPPKFDLEKIKTLPLSGTFEQSKKHYTIREDDITQKIGVMAPIKNTNGEKLTLGKEVTKAFTISEEAIVPDIDYSEVVIPKPIVPQKENLKLQHYATGYGPDKSAEPATPAKKHKRDSTAPESASKKSKKSKSDKEKKEKKEKKKSKKSKD